MVLNQDHVGHPLPVKSVTDGCGIGGGTGEGDSPNGTAQTAQPLLLKGPQRL